MVDVLDLDLARTAVFVDFDGTLSEADTGVHLLERLAPSAWRDISAASVRGEIGSRECLLDEWDLLPKDEPLLRADEVFAKGPLAAWCERSGVPFRRFERLADVHAALSSSIAT